jgi:hypothetical protein
VCLLAITRVTLHAVTKPTAFRNRVGRIRNGFRDESRRSQYTRQCGRDSHTDLPRRRSERSPSLQHMLGHQSIVTAQPYAKLTDDAVRAEAEESWGTPWEPRPVDGRSTNLVRVRVRNDRALCGEVREWLNRTVSKAAARPPTAPRPIHRSDIVSVYSMTTRRLGPRHRSGGIPFASVRFRVVRRTDRGRNRGRYGRSNAVLSETSSAKRLRNPSGWLGETRCGMAASLRRAIPQRM